MSIVALSSHEARELTDRIKVALGMTWEAIKDAYHGRAWSALGYSTWDDYCSAEFGSSRLRLPREERQEVVASLRESGLSVRAIAAATGNDTRTVQSDLRSGVGNSHTSSPAPPASDSPVDELEADYLCSDGETFSVHADYPCSDCGETFTVEVWECPDCHHHLAYEHHGEGDCKYCHKQTITGIDGKQYPQKPTTAAKRNPLPQQASDGAWALRKAVERLERVFADDRFSANKEQVAMHSHGHLSYAIEVCQDLINQLNDQGN